jgi:hypothetical protein
MSTVKPRPRAGDPPARRLAATASRRSQSNRKEPTKRPQPRLTGAPSDDLFHRRPCAPFGGCPPVRRECGLPLNRCSSGANLNIARLHRGTDSLDRRRGPVPAAQSAEHRVLLPVCGGLVSRRQVTVSRAYKQRRLADTPTNHRYTSHLASLSETQDSLAGCECRHVTVGQLRAAEDAPGAAWTEWQSTACSHDWAGSELLPRILGQFWATTLILPWRAIAYGLASAVAAHHGRDEDRGGPGPPPKRPAERLWPTRSMTVSAYLTGKRCAGPGPSMRLKSRCAGCWSPG